MAEPATQPHTCRGCGKPGHNIRRCPDADVNIEGAAELRAEIDALEVMEAEYLAVAAAVAARLAETKVSKEIARRRLAELRAARGS